MIEFTRHHAREYLRKARDERGKDYVYKDHFGACRNTVNGGPACLVGLALWRFGEDHNLPAAFMINHEGTAIDTARSLKVYQILNIKDDAVLILRTAQEAQDNGADWGEAYRRAVSLYFYMDELDM